MTQQGRLLVHAGTFAVLDAQGDAHGGHGAAPDGLFVHDARHLSRWQLSIDGAAPQTLVPAGQDEDIPVVLTPAGTRDEPPRCTLFRQQALCEGILTERIHVLSNVAHLTDILITLHVDVDFADQFELRTDRRTYPKPGATRTVTDSRDRVTFAYLREAWRATTVITARPAPVITAPAPEGTSRLLSWQLTLPGHGSADLTVTVAPQAGGTDRTDDRAPARTTAGQGRNRPVTGELAHEEGLTTPGAHPDLARACSQGLTDLARLSVPATGPDGETLYVPGAGVPWFLTLFGRDSLLTSYFALPYRPRLANATLLALAATQATAYDAGRIAEPGKIVHEIRHGELAHFGQVPYGRYYGSVDSTPLFLVLLHAYVDRTADTALALQLERHARAAVEWMFRDGGLETSGYLVYEADEKGLLNQNWKDSAGAICFADGTQASGAIAAAEVQGYAYDALRRTAALARTVWQDTTYAERLEAAATRLRERFRDDFWMSARDFPALALDGNGRQADALASDAGHLLWSGILDTDDARTVGRRLLEPDFFSGWGIRTLAAGQTPYHPLSYHRGSIWPHDNAIIVLGMARSGLHTEAAAVTGGLLDVAAQHGHRLPEVISGYGREEAQRAIPYPHANSPQAWAAATPLALLTASAGRTES